ncbi:MAG TPA: PEP-CTERM sorting domain-containing protein [Pirellulales bacterium]|jgi:hypothetical protein
MFCAHLNRLGKRFVVGWAAACLFFALAVRPAGATNCSYSIAISEDLTALETDQPSTLHTTMAEWVYLRNNPYLEITNTSDPGSNAKLDSLTVQLHNPTQNLSLTQINLDVVGGVSITSPTLGSLPTVGASAITLNFDSLDPGDSMIFRVHLVPVTNHDTKFADYRQIFFSFDNTTSQNADSTAFFSLPDNSHPQAGPNTWNSLPANLATTTSFGIAYSCLNTPDTVITIPAQTGSNPAVPEPSTLFLGSLSLVGVLLGRKRLGAKQV